MAALSLVSLNVERKKHLDRIVPFLRERNPDVVCLQEVCGADVAAFAEAFSALETQYVPMSSQHELTGEINEHGLCILSRLPMSNKRARYYFGDASHLPISDERIAESWTHGNNRVVALGDIKAENVTFRIGTTHFTWSERGEVTELQREHLKGLLAILQNEKEFVLTGDFNAPRGGEIFSELASRYKDNIPPEYKTSLDLELHRAAKERRHELETKMVDGLFSTPAYTVSNVELVSGLSDHCAVVAELALAR